MADKQLNVNLSINAETAAAKKALQDLQGQLSSLISSASKGNNGLGLNADIEKAVSSATQLKAILSASTSQNGLLNLNTFNKNLKASGTDLKTFANNLSALGPQGSAAFQSVAKSILSAEVPLKRTNALLTNFKNTMVNVAKYQISTNVFNTLVGSLQTAYNYAQDLNESLNNIRIVTGYGSDRMAAFAKEANEAAKALSTTTTAYTDASLIYYQQGLSDAQVKQRTDVTIKMANVAKESATEVSSYMTAIWNNFDDGTASLEHYADVMTKLGASTAASSAEIAAGIEKFAAVTKVIGLSYDYATASLATIVDKTRESADVVGNALKTLFSRIEGLSLGKTLEDGTDLNKYSKALNAVGINIKDATGNLKDMDTILDEMGEKWGTLAKDQQMALAQTVAGVRQYTQLVTMMDYWGDVKKNVGIAREADGELNKQAATYAQGWEAAEKRVQAALEGIYQKLINDNAFINILNTIEKVVTGIGKFIDAIGGLNSLLPLTASLMLKAFSPNIASTLNAIPSFFSDIKQAKDNGAKIGDYFSGNYKMINANAMRQEAVNLQTSTVDNSGARATFQMQADAQGKILALKQQLLAVDTQINAIDQATIDIHMQNLSAITEENAKIGEQVNLLQDALEAAKTTADQTGVSEEFKTLSNWGKTLGAGDSVLNISSGINDWGKDADALEAFQNRVKIILENLRTYLGTDFDKMAENSSIIQALEKIAEAGQDVDKTTQAVRELNNAVNKDTGTANRVLNTNADSLNAKGINGQEVLNNFRQLFSQESKLDDNIDAAKRISDALDKVLSKAGQVTKSLGEVGAQGFQAFTKTLTAIRMTEAAVKTCSDSTKSWLEKATSVGMAATQTFNAMGQSLKVVQTLTKAMNWGNGITAALSAAVVVAQSLLTIWTAARQKEEELRKQHSASLQKAVKETSDHFNEIVQEADKKTEKFNGLTSLYQQYLETGEASDDFRNTLAELAEQYEIEDAQILLLGEHYDLLAQKIANARDVENGEIVDSADAAHKAAVISLKDKLTNPTTNHFVAENVTREIPTTTLTDDNFTTTGAQSLQFNTNSKYFSYNSEDGKPHSFYGGNSQWALTSRMRDDGSSYNTGTDFIAPTGYGGTIGLNPELIQQIFGLENGGEIFKGLMSGDSNEFGQTLEDLRNDYNEIYQEMIAAANETSLVMGEIADGSQIVAAANGRNSNDETGPRFKDTTQYSRSFAGPIQLNNEENKQSFYDTFDKNSDYFTLNEQSGITIKFDEENMEDALKELELMLPYLDSQSDLYQEISAVIADINGELDTAAETQKRANEAAAQNLAISRAMASSTDDQITSMRELKDAREDDVATLMQEQGITDKAEATRLVNQAYGDAGFDTSRLQALDSLADKSAFGDKIYDIFDGLNKELQNIFFTIPVELFTDEDELYKFLDNQQKILDANALQAKITTTRTARADLEKSKGFNTVEDALAWKESSGIAWGTEGIITYREFMEKTYEEQLQYLKDLESAQNEMYLHGADGQESALDAAIKANQAQQTMLKEQLAQQQAIYEAKTDAVRREQLIGLIMENTGKSYAEASAQLDEEIATDGEAILALQNELSQLEGIELDLLEEKDIRLLWEAKDALTAIVQLMGMDLSVGSKISKEIYNSLTKGQQEFLDKYGEFDLTGNFVIRRIVVEENGKEVSLQDGIYEQTQMAAGDYNTQTIHAAPTGTAYSSLNNSISNNSEAWSWGKNRDNAGVASAQNSVMDSIVGDSNSAFMEKYGAQLMGEGIIDIDGVVQDYDKLYEVICNINDVGASGELLATNASSLETLNDLYDKGLITIEQYKQAGFDIETTAIQNAKSLDDLQAIVSKFGNANVDLNAAALREALMNMASEYENCTDELTAYTEALQNGTAAEIAAAQSKLELALKAGELGAQFGIDAERIEMLAYAFSEMDQYAGLTGEQLSQLAAKNIRYNEGLLDIKTNLKDYSSFMEKIADNTVQEITSNDSLWKSFSKIQSSVADLLGVEKKYVSANFLKDHFKDIEAAVKGDEKAMQRLSAAMAKEMMKINSSLSDIQIDTLMETMDGYLNGLEIGPIENTDFLNSLANILLQAGMTAEQIQAAFAEMGIQCDVTPVYDALDGVADAGHIAANNLAESMIDAEGNIVDSAVKAGQAVADNNSFTSNVETMEVDGEETQTYTTAIPNVTDIPLSANLPFLGGLGNFSIPAVTSWDFNPVESTTEKTAVASGVTVENANYTGTGGVSNTNSKAPGPRGGGSGRRGGGSGRRAERNSAARKDPSGSAERYHVVNNQLEDLAKGYDAISKAKDRAFGAAKIKLMDQEIKILDDQIKKQKEKTEEVKKYLALDRQRLQNVSENSGAVYGTGDNATAEIDRMGAEQYLGMSVEFDANGTITNYKALMDAADARYDAAVAEFENATTDDEDAKKQFDLEQARYDNFIKLIQQYEETQDLMGDEAAALLEKENAKYDKMLEETNYIVKIKVDVEDDKLKLLDYYLGKIKDDAFAAADQIALLNGKISSSLTKTEAYQDGIRGIFMNHGLSDEESQSLLTRFIGGDKEAQAAVQAMNLTENEVDTLRDHMQNLLKENTNIMDGYKELYNTIGKYFDAVNDKAERSLNKMAHLQKMTNNYEDIIDIVGQDNLGVTSEAMATLRSAQQTQANNITAGKQAELEGAQSMLAQMQKAKQDLINSGTMTPEQQKLMDEQIDHMEDKVMQLQEDVQDALKDSLNLLKDNFSKTLQQAARDFSKSMAGIAGNLQGLEFSMNLKKEEDENYLPEYERVYELTKLTRDIEKSIDNTSNVKAKRELAALEDEILQAREEGKELSEYDIEYMRKRYELKLAEMALDESKNAKSQVRMQRDNEGNYGYVYTADESAVEDAQQNYEDKLYEMQKMNADYINALQDSILQLMTEQEQKIAELADIYEIGSEEYNAALEELQAHYANQMEYYNQQMDNVLGNNKILYEEEVQAHAAATGNKAMADEQYIESFGQLPLAIQAGYDTAESFQEAWKQNSEKLYGDVGAAAGNFKNDVETAMNAAGLSMSDFKTNVDSNSSPVLDRITEMANETDDLRDSIEQLAEDSSDAFGDIVQNMKDWVTKYKDEVRDMIEKNENLADSIQAVIAAWSAYDGAPGGGGDDPGPTEPEPTEPQENPTGGGNTEEGVIGEITVAKGYQYWGYADAASKKHVRVINDDRQEHTYKVSQIDTKHNRVLLKDEGLWMTSVDSNGKNRLKLTQFDTGGYTGDWGEDGRLAMLHQKELVLNATDTENLLNAVDLVRQIAQAIDLNANAMSGGLGAMFAATVKDNNQTIEQQVTITAEFPNVTDKNEILSAFDNIVNLASQYANRK